MSSSTIMHAPSQTFASPMFCHCSSSGIELYPLLQLSRHLSVLAIALPTSFDLILALSIFNLIAFALLRDIDPREQTTAAARLALRTQRAVKATLLVVILHTLRCACFGVKWATGSAYFRLPVGIYTAGVCAIAVIAVGCVVMLWPTALEIDPKAFPYGRPVEFYEFGVEEADVLPAYVVMHLRARGLRTEQWRNTA